MTDYRIQLPQAQTLVKQFITRFNPEENNIPIGGTIHKNTLYGQNKFLSLHNGNMAWYCWSEDAAKFPKLFLAFEENDSYDTGEVVVYPDMPKLIRPTNIILYDGRNVDTMVQSHRIHPSAYIDVQIDREGTDGVISLKDSFLHGSPRDPLGKPFNKFPYSFFENRVNGDVKAFVGQSGLEYIRYYFGFDDVTTGHAESNRIRIILVGVDKDGNNLPNSKGDSIILQNSWPPPPESKKV